MMTRKTLLRVLLAIRLFESGRSSDAYYALPKKFKIGYLSPMHVWMFRENMRMLSQTLRPYLQQFMQSEGHQKIGDKLQVRKPARYAA